MAYIHGGSILRHYASSLHGLPHSIVTEVPLIRYHDGKPSPVFLPGKSQGQRRLAGYSPWGHKESDTTEHAHAIPHQRCLCLNSQNLRMCYLTQYLS